MKKILEKDLIKTVLDYLAVKKILAWRNNTGGFMKEKHFYRFGEIGSPDIFAVKNGKIYGIECKVKGNSQSESQKEFEKKFNKAGGIYILAYDLNDVCGII